ncbi:hypothetical protein ACLK1S_20270 [Escherichia coli]
MECRIDAGDAAEHLPASPSKITETPGLAAVECVGSLIFRGLRIPPYYDSMIGKLICYGENRDVAIAHEECAAGA